MARRKNPQNTHSHSTALRLPDPETDQRIDQANSIEPNPTITGLRDEIEIKFVEQEHRIVSVVRNVLQYRNGPESLRKAALASAATLITRLLIRGSVTGSLGLIAILGLLAAIRANDLLAQQNRKIDQQTLLIDAQRRASLNIEISSIWEQLREETPDGPKLTAFQPSDTLTARVVALTRALSPYIALSSAEASDQNLERQLERQDDFLGRFFTFASEPELMMEERALSPERGQLLVALTSIGADVSYMSSRGATFAFADLREQMLSFPRTELYDLTGIDFSGSALWRTDFTGSILTDANFSCVHLEHVVFGFNGSPFFADNANFRYVDLGSYVVGPADPEEPAPTTYYMSPAIFSYIDVSDSFLVGLTFSGYDSIEDIPLPDSFDRQRYTLTQSGDEFVVEAIDPAIEASRSGIGSAFCSRYEIADPRLARIMWGEVLEGEGLSL